ncbi:RAMA domain-containing protein OS=Streptomyces antimycoticus OX=68175 GN=SANT12839_101730 PE=4 SV=1 [Streptomyces antimycoticus]
MSKPMRTIEIDDEVFAYLQRHGEPLVDSPNDVLRRLLLNGGRPRPIQPGAPAP